MGATTTSSNLCADATACATVLEYNGQNRLVRWANGDTIADVSTHELMDNNDIAVNDRVSIRTMNSHTYETRTVDYINLQGLGASTDNFFTVSQPFTAAHAEKRIFLNFKGTPLLQHVLGVGYAMVRLLNANASKDTPDRLVKSRMRWQHKCDDLYMIYIN